MITFEQLWPAIFLLLLPYLWWARGRSLSTFQPRHLSILTAVRSALIVCLAIALMEPTIHRSGRWTSVVYGIDMSQSISPAARAETLRWIAEANRRGRPDHWEVVAFGGRGVTLDRATSLERLEEDDLQLLAAIDPSATNLEAGLDQALRSFAPDHLKRLVLFTDGHPTSGELASALLRLQREGVRVYTLPAPARAVQDAWVDAVRAPVEVLVEEPFRVDVELHSQVARAGVVELSNADRVLATQAVQLGPGPNHVTLEVTLDAVRRETVEIRLLADDDPLPLNNTRREAIMVRDRPRVLYVEGRPASARHFRRALEIGGLSVETRPPSALPADAAGLTEFAVVVLSDVPRADLTQRQMAALASYVADLGGGFVLAGGESVFGEEGYSDTPIEDILPVTFTTKEKPREVALIIVLDKSWSMAGTKIELSKEASKAAVDVLEDEHSIGVVSFNNDLDWPVRLQSASNRELIKQRISTIVPSGYTNIYPALEAAYDALVDVTARIKHVILLSDGRTYPAEYERLLTEMAEQEMTVSTVAVGSEADRVLLGNIAEWGGGRSYLVDDAAEVPQIFTEETERAARPTLMEESFAPIVRKQAEVFAGVDFDSAPPLGGYTSTQLKDTAEALLLTEDDDPILARWPYGLGRTVAFTSDVKDRWAADWLAWAGYGKLWTQLVRETMQRPEDDSTRAFQARREGDTARIVIESVRPDGTFGNMETPRLEVTGPDDQTFTVEAHQVGPGLYEATVPLDTRGDYRFDAVDDEGAGVSRAMVYSYPDEYRFTPPRLDLLRAISESTGGVLAPTVEDLFARDDESTVLPTPLWVYFASLALALFLVDLWLRRIRLFEPH